MSSTNAFWADLAQQQPLMPVASIDDLNLAITWGEQMITQGFRALEMTLRGNNCLTVLNGMQRHFGRHLLLGAGSALDVAMAQAALAAGARFIVSPGATETLVAFFKRQTVPWLPGVATLSESLKLYELDFQYQKFFPAKHLGGWQTLAAWSGPCPNLNLCPTGGIELEDLPQYLNLSNVFMVGTSAITPKDKNDNYSVRVAAWQQQLPLRT